MDRLKCIEAFVCVANAGSFIGAAKALGISRPMVSKQVQWLEDELGIRLINRTTRRLSLTEAGRVFHGHCEAIISHINDAMQEVTELQINPTGELRINAPHSFGRVHLSRTLSAFLEQYPDITVRLTLNDRLVDLVDEGFDMAVRIGDLVDSTLTARSLGPCRIIACASPDYLDKRGVPQSPSDLCLHNCLCYEYLEGNSWRFTRDGKTEKVAVTGDFKSNFGDAIVNAALTGRGVIYEPTFMTSQYLISGELIPLLNEYETKTLGIRAVYPQGRLLPRKVRVLIDFLVKAYGSQPYWDDDIVKP